MMSPKIGQEKKFATHGIHATLLSKGYSSPLWCNIKLIAFDFEVTC
jgi:hypothetical protein